eukprot:TRINITY_DN23888_c0_g1_i1.p1 TRINITY_DN23888_c0_g1~~TRINITY_DN23888_c0_g1_i1.p1  ORF type:complete len:546 (+),score=126.62 TRINITY_DN23888_c0_g1_i1:66-1640(+)
MASITPELDTTAFLHLKDGIRDLSLALHAAHSSVCEADITMALDEVPQDDTTISFISYNLLADIYAAGRAADDEGHTAGQFDHVKPEFLEWQYRFELLQRDVAMWHADVVCFQEVEKATFTDQLLPMMTALGYDGQLQFDKKHSPTRAIDNATFYRRSRFKLVKTVSRSHAFVTLLQLADESCLAVVNCHLTADPAKDDSRTAQMEHTMTLLSELEPTYIIMAGDFNAQEDAMGAQAVLAPATRITIHVGCCSHHKLRPALINQLTRPHERIRSVSSSLSESGRASPHSTSPDDDDGGSGVTSPMLSVSSVSDVESSMGLVSLNGRSIPIFVDEIPDDNDDILLPSHVYQDADNLDYAWVHGHPNDHEHDYVMVSAYHAKPCPTFVNSAKLERIDQLFTSCNIHTCAILDPYQGRRPFILRHGLPNRECGSDHLPIGAVFQLCKGVHARLPALDLQLPESLRQQWLDLLADAPVHPEEGKPTKELMQALKAHGKAKKALLKSLHPALAAKLRKVKPAEEEKVDD